MADVTSGSHLYWEAADTTGISEKITLQIVMLAWVSNDGTNMDIAADDDLSITDGNDIEVITKRAEAAGDGIDPVCFNPPLKMSGIKIAKLGGGVVHITVRDPIPA